MNIDFEYIYRDAGNNKIWNRVVFANPLGLSTVQILGLIRPALIDQQYFVADEVRLPILRFPVFDQDLDHDWYEYSTVEETQNDPDDILERTIDEFIMEVIRSSRVLKIGGT
jgi:hypothetical protein